MPVARLTDDQLVARALRGASEALLELYERYRDRIMGFAYRMTGRMDLAEDAFHSTFVYLCDHLDRYEPRGKFAAYLFRIARSKIADEQRVARNKAKLADNAERVGLAPDVDSVATPDDTADLEEQKRMATEALDKLPDHLREVVVLRLYDGLSHAEIGEVVGVNEATARSRLRYALERLRELLRKARTA
jgi:RNA polymerase sigma-70 factor (ECF subfamily)